MRNKNAKVCDPSSFVTNSGDTELTLYSSKVLPTGEIHLTESGKENIQDTINSYRESCDMSYILQQLAVGNTSVLEVNRGFYADLSKAPENIFEAMQIMIDGEQAFHQLPVEVQQSFDNSFMNWLATSNSPEWLEKMKTIIPPSTAEVNLETKEGESV